MRAPELKASHKLVRACYTALARLDQRGITRETTVRQPFLDLLCVAAGAAPQTGVAARAGFR